MKRRERRSEQEHGIERVSFTLKKSWFQGGEKEGKQIEPFWEKEKEFTGEWTIKLSR